MDLTACTADASARPGAAMVQASGRGRSGGRGLGLGRGIGLAASALCAAALGGCAGSLSVDARYQAQGQDSRAQFLILHFTDEDFATSLRLLTGPRVSSHYLVSDETPPRVYRLVDESRRAWHAGDSAWRGQTQLNAASIGIEIVNLGPEAQPDGTLAWAPYPPAQIDLVLALVQDIVARHQIRPDRILGHSDIAPQRKQDPGPAFPWHRLAEAGLIPWPDPARVAALRPGHQARPPDAAWFQQQLASLGYAVPKTAAWDEPTRRVLAAFQMKYRPQRHDGHADAHTAALLEALTAAAAP